ncbi:MAG TPA: dienelactone hydrolase family protein [Candidatus Elarobacter sp.]|nr:dienelactone hydrolase family protein [Candidatus Elarobacter sp.]
MKLRSVIAAALSTVVIAAGQPAKTIAAPAPAAVTAEGVTFASADRALTAPLTGSLYRAPASGKPAAAIVLLHQCPGIDQFVLDWGAWFAAHGYTALVVDSLTARKIKPGTCDPAALPVAERGRDALGGLAYLRSLPDVDKSRVAVVGWAFGGAAAVAAATKEETDAARAGGPFRAAIAFYPPCGGRTSSVVLAAPLLMLLAADATANPTPVCEAAIAQLKSNGQNVDSHTYPKVKDDFDNPAQRLVTFNAGKGAMGSTAVTRFDAGAADDAHARVAAFLLAQMP